MTFLDTNIILRYVLGDNPAKAIRCEHLFNRAATGHVVLRTHVLAIAEVIWVMTGTYQQAKERVVDALVRLLTIEGIALDDKERVLSALGLYRAMPIDFVDAYHAQYMRDRHLTTVYSYDTDFDLISGIQRVEP